VAERGRGRKPKLPAVGGRRGSDASARRRSRLLGDERGQATVELVAAVPALLLAALISLQLLAVGYALTLADGAAEAGALALAEGSPAAEAARDALPGWAADDVSVAVEGEQVSVRLRPPSPFGAIADHLAVTSTASARAAE
jgi:Flp pilus assembly protein TadG